ncbi:hypothetical protein K466DRAFT_606766 [Polyporus arcularius HHB13444]|uniref:Uncharacterized protein n=1 Tax=Polyporus arcularius HHB13444 TaxID=1314778 RepID=A0A5C3NLS2_9APHY|nr:hypothetical protein K466DRAFT_606766 [Polyporus arcularius HHB13444]
MPAEPTSTPSSARRKTRSSASRQADTASDKQSAAAAAAAAKLREVGFREHARTMARRQPAVAPLCSHRLKIDVQYLKGDTNDGRFIGKCSRAGCVPVQYLSKRLSAQELTELNAQRPAGLFDRIPLRLSSALSVSKVVQEWDVLGYYKNDRAAAQSTLLPWTRLRDALLGWCPDMRDSEIIAWCTTSRRTWSFIRVKDIRSESIKLIDGDILVWTREDVSILPDLPTYAPGLGMPDWSEFWRKDARAMSPVTSTE